MPSTNAAKVLGSEEANVLGSEEAKVLGSEDMSLEELFVLAQDDSAEGRQSLFENMRDLFLDDGSSVSDREKALMGEILRRLVHDVELKLRKSLAEKLSKRSDTPHALIVELANDDFEVAHPILIESNVLQDADLIETIRHRTMEHQLAISVAHPVPWTQVCLTRRA